MNRRSSKAGALCRLGLLLMLWMPSPADGQSIFASIVGTVKDASSAVIPGATVAATSPPTRLAGFTKYRNERLALASNESARVDVTLQVSTEVTQVSVSAESGSPIETESAKLGDVRSLKQLQTLPLAARSISRYLILTPGVTRWMNGTMSVSGSRSRQVDYAVDGVTMSDLRSSNTIGPALSFIEAFEEATISMGNNSAEFKALSAFAVDELQPLQSGNQGLIEG